jgi:phosphoglycerate dehydrogenase-like enzyme
MHLIWTNRPVPADLQPLAAGKSEFVGPFNEIHELPIDALGRVEGIIANATTRYDAALFKRLPKLRVVSRIGIGYDNVIVPDATAAGVAVCNTPEGPTSATSELTIMLMVAAARQFSRANGLMRGRDPRTGADFFSKLDGVQLNGKQLGLIGFGRIGRRVAQIARAIGMSVVAYDPIAKPEDGRALGVTILPSIDDVLRAADVVSLHVPSSPETRGMMDARRFALMKKGAIFVNAARGTLVDEKALYDALKSGHLFGAGIDVFEIEPPDPRHPLLTLDTLVALPHIGGNTQTSRAAMWRGALENALAVVTGARPAYLVNEEVWPKPIRR